VEVEMEESESKVDDNGNGGGDDGHKDDDEEADDLYDTDKEEQKENISDSDKASFKTPEPKHGGASGSKTVSKEVDKEDLFDQERQLKESMESFQGSIPVICVLEEGAKIGTDINLSQEALAFKAKDRELKFQYPEQVPEGVWLLITIVDLRWHRRSIPRG
jgi:hypothetical protein